uniref:Uncharacterized protein n=1 Tax=Hanusia phi TaxID=3032 RepID=A0A7S0NDG0_9CRYP|mmetsp:Transcript_6758/g.15610  ORF Transcript_6758/g.15610 Transcript_6758/m.15610 type:complete len:365 (+) Transcript_6758:203-1297(+)
MDLEIERLVRERVLAETSALEAKFMLFSSIFISIIVVLIFLLFRQAAEKRSQNQSNSQQMPVQEDESDPSNHENLQQFRNLKQLIRDEMMSYDASKFDDVLNHDSDSPTNNLDSSLVWKRTGSFDMSNHRKPHNDISPATSNGNRHPRHESAIHLPQLMGHDAEDSVQPSNLARPVVPPLKLSRIEASRPKPGGMDPIFRSQGNLMVNTWEAGREPPPPRVSRSPTRRSSASPDRKMFESGSFRNSRSPERRISSAVGSTCSGSRFYANIVNREGKPRSPTRRHSSEEYFYDEKDIGELERLKMRVQQNQTIWDEERPLSSPTEELSIYSNGKISPDDDDLTCMKGAGDMQGNAMRERIRRVQS